jgi:hypothetical protein
MLMVATATAKCSNEFSVLAVVGFVMMKGAAADVDEMMSLLPELLPLYCASLSVDVFREVIAGLSRPATNNSLNDLHDRLHYEMGRHSN